MASSSSLPSPSLSPAPFPGPTASSLLSISATAVRSRAVALIESTSGSTWPEPLYYGSRTLRATRRAWPWLWRMAACACAAWGVYYLWRRRKLRARQKNVERAYTLFGPAVRFGLDIGGTLCKVVYFEPQQTTTGVQAALKARVTAFIRRSHSYGVTGRRDAELEVSLGPIKGTLHFLKFQTSMMPNFITIVRENELAPARPLATGGSAGGSTDERSAEEEEAAARRNNANSHHHHHAHHLHHPSQVPAGQVLANASHMNRSYSAAWRSEDEFRQQCLSAAQQAQPESETPLAAPLPASAPVDELPLDALPPTDHSDVPAAPSTDASAESAASSSTTPCPATAEIDAPHSRASSASPTIPVIASAVESVATIHPRAAFTAAAAASSSSSSSSSTSVAATTATATPGGHSRVHTPPTMECSSASCPSSPLHSANLHRAQSLRQSAAAAFAETHSPAVLATDPAHGYTTVLNNREPFIAAPKRVILPSPPTVGPVPPSVCATGGGAFKFEKLFRDELHITLHKEDELRALVKGIDFMIHSCPESECYYLEKYRFREPLVRSIYASRSISYPYLVVNIGSGVSILKVTGPSTFERVGGTSLGGGTFYGLTRALTGCTSFEEALELAEAGRSGTADLLVGDIYGGAYDELGLAADTVAASFGKLVRGDGFKDVSKADLAKAALVMITNNIGSLANLYARKVLHVPQIIFCGNFLNSNDIAKRGLAFATDYWSQGQAKALFLTHEGYFGAVGSLLGDKY